MDCTAARELLSAQLDGETSDHESGRANDHLGRCVDCRRWWSDVGIVTRHLRVRSAETMPDLAAQVLSRVSPPRPGAGEWIRYALAVVAATDLLMSLPGLLIGEGAASVHDARHLGSFGVAMAVGMLYVARRPTQAWGILPIVAALAVTMCVTAGIDLALGRVGTLDEAHHLLGASGLVLVWMLAGHPLPQRRKRTRSAPHAAGKLRPTH